MGLLLLLMAAWFVRGPLLGPLVARLGATALADALHGQAVIQHATGGWLGDAQLTGIRLTGPGPVPAWTVTVEQLDADYGLRLLRGDLRALHQVTVVGLAVTVIQQAPAADDAPESWPGLLAKLPAVLPRLHIDGSVSIRNGDSETRLDGIRLAVVQDQLEVTIARMSTSSFTMSLPTCVLQRSAKDTLSLAKPVTLDLPSGLPQVQVDLLHLILGEAVQQLEIGGRLAGGSWHMAMSARSMRIELQGVDLARLTGLPSSIGNLPVDAVIERLADGWAVSSLHLTGDGVELQAQAVLHPAPWRFVGLRADLAVDLERIRRLIPDLPAMHGKLRIDLHGSAPLHPLDWLHGDVSLAISGTEVVLGGVPSTPLQLAVRMQAGVIQVQDLAARWHGVEARLGAPDASPITADSTRAWRLLPRSIRIAGGILRIEASGDAQGQLEGSLRLAGLPLQGLPGLVTIRHLTGTVDGEIRLAGTLRHPIWTASLSVADLVAKLTPDVPTLTGGQARLAFAKNVLSVESLHGDLGGARLEVQGRVDFAGGRQAIDVTCTGNNVLLVQRSDARVRANLDLRLHGSLSEPMLTGAIAVSNALITPELHLSGRDTTAAAPADNRIVLFELLDPPLSKLRFDVRVTSSSGTAEQPDRGLRVATRWGRGSCDLDLHLGGTGIAPMPQGRVSVRDGVVTLPFSTLTVTHGELLFPSDDPFQPQVSVNAGARIRQYDVQVMVSGTLTDPIVRITGSGLDEQEAMLLLTTGSTPRELRGEQGQKAALGRVGTWLGQKAWREIDGPDDPDAGQPLSDRVNIEWGRSTSVQGRDTIDSEFELTEPGSRPALLLYGQRDRYDQYNAGLLLRFSWGGDEP